ncbi:MAG: DUF3473 domain-containing protein, partial [Candidatus Latescibacteria bacterium]|nr:DUF3473 domain-containing protein [Candidatus Latescibacterota bacterium]
LVTTDLFGCTLPVAGGGYFRLLPRIVISFLLKRSSVSPKVFYFHPYEFSNNILSIREAVATIGLVKNIKISLFQNLFRKSIVGKVRRLLKQGKFITMGECYGNTKPESAVLLSSLGS